ncbi:MAG: serine hydrolase domain-containing protein [Marinicellaceae bacterium]
MKKTISFATLFLLLVNFISQAKGLPKNQLEEKIDALVSAEINDKTPGLIIGIVHKEEIIFSKGYGLANLSHNIPNNPKLVYNTGSVSKQFLGYAFAMLHVDGKLHLDDPVTKFLEDWPEFEHKVTLRHLLSHTSGYREAYTMSNLAGRIVGIDYLSRKECLDVVRNQPELEFIPGSRYTYNSTSWVILSEVLKKVTGQESDKWVKENILKPLKMDSTQIESFVGEVINNAAESYALEEEKGYVNYKSNRAIFGAAEVYSNIPDMVKWMNNFKTAKVGGKKVNELFLKPFVLNDGTNSEYALGINNGSYKGVKRYRHTGGHEAFSTQLSYFPEHDLGIFTVSNFGGKASVPTSKIADILLAEHLMDQAANKNIEIDKSQLENFAGLYLSENHNSSIELTMLDGALQRGNTRLIPISENTFLYEGSDTKILIESTKGQTQLIPLNRAKQSYLKVDQWQPKATDLITYKGDYWSDELEALYHLVIKDNKLTVQYRWLDDIKLNPVTKDVFVSDWGFYVTFNRNEKNEITGLSVSSGRTLNVIFNR